jgi:hypothetical protein
MKFNLRVLFFYISVSWSYCAYPAVNLSNLITAATNLGPVVYVIPVLIEPYKWREFRLVYSLKYSQFVFKHKWLQLIVFT